MYMSCVLSPYVLWHVVPHISCFSRMPLQNIRHEMHTSSALAVVCHPKFAVKPCCVVYTVVTKLVCMQLEFATFADNKLTGEIPFLPKIINLNISSNSFTKASFTNLPACKFLYCRNNDLGGLFPAPDALPANLTLLDVSSNRFSGSLPSAVPFNLTVLNLDGNNLSGTLPSSWRVARKLVALALGNNLFSGTLPPGWSEWGKQSRNSLHLSVVNTRLSGKIPRQWVQQFCLSVVRIPELQVLGRALNITVKVGSLGDFNQTVGLDVLLPSEAASINVTLGNKLYSFDYNSPDSICGIPHAVRNLGLLWGTFAALLVLAAICVQLWLRRKPCSASTGLFSKLGKVTRYLHHDKLHIPKQIATRLQFLVLDVVYFLYSQVTDVVTIHQVFGSGQLRYAYLLLAFLLFPFVCMLLPVAKVTTRMCASKFTVRTPMHTVFLYVAGMLLSPVMLLVLEFELILCGIGVPVPKWLQLADVDMYSVHRLQTYAESCLNAFPQALLQSKLYLMGNDPNGVHVYIDTTLFVFSMVGSMASILKTALVFSVERHTYTCGLVRYFSKLYTFSSLEDCRVGARTPSQTSGLISRI